MYFLFFFFECYGDHLELHVLTHSCPTRRSSDLVGVEDDHSPKSTGGRIASRGTSGRSTPPNWPKRSLIAWPRLRGRGISVESAERRMSRASRSEEHTSELQSLMRISYAVFCLKKQKKRQPQTYNIIRTTP